MTSNRLARAIALASSVFFFAACSGQAKPGSTGEIDIVVSSALVAADISQLDVTVTAGGGFNVTRSLRYDQRTNQWTGLIGGIPAGPASFTAVAYGLDGVTIVAQTSAPVVVTIPSAGVVDVNLVLQDLTGGQPFANDAPVIEAVAVSPGEVSPGLNASISALASDADGDPIAWTASVGGVPFATGTGTSFSASYSNAVEGDYTVVLTADDGRGAVSSASFVVRVRQAPGRARVFANINSAPVISGMTAAPLPVIIGQPSTAAVTAVGTGLTYAWSSPDCPTILFATPAVAATSFVLPAAVPPNADPVSCTLQVVVSSGPLAVNTGTLVVPVGPAFVNHPPVIISVAQDLLGGVVGDVVTMTAVAYDLDNDQLEALWTVTPIDSSVLGAGTFVESTLTTPSTWTATNTLTLACAAVGDYLVTVDIFDVLAVGGTPLSAGDQFTFVVGCAP